MSGKSFENGDNDDGKRRKPISMDTHTHTHIYTLFENGFVVSFGSREWKGNFDAARRIKSVCTERRRDEGRILRLKG